MNAYSPFQARLDKLEASDLCSLLTAAEGWYVEYKREEVSAPDLAKSLSAFANTYGGWLFIGVAEESKTNPVAGSFPGLPAAEVDAVLQRLRKSASDHVNPTPHFETKVLYGPCSAIGFAAERAVICVWVPQSASAPHVHKSGRIYRRVADASEPKPESDRFVLDQLWRRQDAVKHRHERWDQQDPEFSEGEKKTPFLRLMLVADPWFERDLWIDADEEEIRNTFNDPMANSQLPFDAVYTSSEGFIARQLKGNDPYNLTITWRLRRDLRSDVIVPLPVIEADKPQDLIPGLRGYENASRLASLLQRYLPGKLRVVDLNFLFGVLYAVAETQERFMKLARWSGAYRFRVKLLNGWRTIPFVDSHYVMAQFETRGLPMCLDSRACLPNVVGPGNYLAIDSSTEGSNVSTRGHMLFCAATLLYGVPGWVDHDEASAEQSYFDSLFEAANRARARQELRGKPPENDR